RYAGRTAGDTGREPAGQGQLAFAGAVRVRWGGGRRGRTVGTRGPAIAGGGRRTRRDQRQRSASMTPYLQLRLWWQRASSGDRLAATLALGLVTALVAWALVPTTSGNRSTGLRAGATGSAAAGDQTSGAVGPVE